MKKLLFCMLPLLALAACDTPATTTTGTTDSTAVAATDSSATHTDSAATAEVPPVAVDSPAATPSTPAEGGDHSGKLANPNAGADPISTNYRLTVSFISRGAGIDHETKKKFDKYVTDFGTKNKVKLAYEQVGWGREGEIDYCFKLAEIKDPLLSTFLKESKAMLANNEEVIVKENAPCRVKRK